MITRMEHLNDGTECEGFGLCTTDGRVIGRYEVELLLDWLNTNERASVRLCERHIAEYMSQQVDQRTSERVLTYNSINGEAL